MSPGPSPCPAFLIPALLLCAAIQLSGCGGKKPPLGNSPFSPADSVIRVTSTIQYPDPQRPWIKKTPFTRAGLGTVIEGDRLLVTADLVAHATCIELETPWDGRKESASVSAIDEECNLAVIRPVNDAILRNARPLSLDQSIRTGTRLEILQLEPNGSPALTPAIVTTVAVMPYPADGASFLLYRTATSIPQREGSFVVPALRDGKIAGLVMRYDPKSQSADIIPAPLIARFLKESAKPGFSGLARAGLSWEPVRGTTLREWLGVEKDRSGVYVTSVDPNGPAEKGGVRTGDLLFKAAGKEIDREGNIIDPDHGKISFSNLASLGSSTGDPMVLSYFRSSGAGTGSFGTTTLTLAGRNPLAESSPSRLEGESVPYTFLGALLFQELSRPYLREWGSDWRREAPRNLVYLDAFQEEAPRGHERYVILSAVLPTERNVGFQDLSNRLVLAINGKAIHRLADVTEAAKSPENGFHRIDLEGSAGPIFLDDSTLVTEEEEVRKRYGIPRKMGGN